MQYTPHILIIHRALAPYRIDLFNHLTRRYDADLYLEYGQPLEQDFDLSLQSGRIEFDYEILAPGPEIFPNLRPELVSILRKPYDLILCSEFNLLTAMLYILRVISARPLPRLVSICDDNLDTAVETLRSPCLWSKRWLLDHLDGVILCSEQAKDRYRDLCRGKASKWLYLPIVQDEHYLQQAVERVKGRTEQLRSTYAIPLSRSIILYVGRLEKVKNLPRLLDAFKRVLDEGLDLQLLLVGEGPMEEELRKQSAQLNLSNRVTFAGKQQGSELYAHYGLGEALILPSTQELFGATVAEAMALGLPVAVSEIASSHELIHSESVGNTLSPLSTDDIAYSLKHLYLLIERARGKSSRGSILPKPFSQYMSNLDEYLGRLIAERFNRIDNSKRMNDGTLP